MRLHHALCEVGVQTLACFELPPRDQRLAGAILAFAKPAQRAFRVVDPHRMRNAFHLHRSFGNRLVLLLKRLARTKSPAQPGEARRRQLQSYAVGLDRLQPIARPPFRHLSSGDRKFSLYKALLR